MNYHRYVWIKHYGPIPRGYDIHHINENKHDNRIENLKLLSRKEHIKIHKLGEKNSKRMKGRKLTENQKKNISIAVKKNLPKTSFKKGGIPWNKGLKGVQKHTEKTKNQISKSMKLLKSNS